MVKQHLNNNYNSFAIWCYHLGLIVNRKKLSELFIKFTLSITISIYLAIIHRQQPFRFLGNPHFWFQHFFHKIQIIEDFWDALIFLLYFGNFLNLFMIDFIKILIKLVLNSVNGILKETKTCSSFNGIINVIQNLIENRCFTHNCMQADQIWVVS